MSADNDNGNQPGGAEPQGATWWQRVRALRRIVEKSEPHQPEPVMASGSPLSAMLVVQFRPAWELQAYLRFARLPYRVENSAYAGSESIGLYPSLMDGQFILPADEALRHLSRKRVDIDRNLTKEEKAEAEAFASLVKEGLKPLLRVLRYRADESEVRQTVYPPMRKTLYWPLSMWSPAAEGRRSKPESSLRGFDALDKEELIARARQLYSALDLRLGSKDSYFFGATPTSLDACVFGHLAEAWTIGVLLDLLPAFENLSRFFRGVCAEYFRPGTFPAASEGGDEGFGDDGGVPERKESESREGSEDADEDREDEAGALARQRNPLKEAMMRADYVNSQNNFNQLPGCALCSEVPYIADPYAAREIPNAGIPPPPVLAGGTPEAQAPDAGGETLEDSLPLIYTALTTLIFVVIS